MADVLQSNGLILYVNNSVSYAPFACAKTSTITINRDVIELAPKTNNRYKRYIGGRSSFTISGSGLIKISDPSNTTITFFDSYIEGTNTIPVQGRFEMIDPQGNYKKYSFEAIIIDLSLESTIGSIPSYSFTLQGTGGFTEIP